MNSARRGVYLENVIFDDETCSLCNLDELCDTSSTLTKLKLKNVNGLFIGHVNINSLPGKFDQLKVVIKNNSDILFVTDIIEGFSMPFRFDGNRSGGGVIVYVRDDIPIKQLTEHKLPDDIDGVFTEANLRKIKWLIFGTYRPPSQSGEYFFKHVGYALDPHGQTYEKF